MKSFVTMVALTALVFFGVLQPLYAKQSSATGPHIEIVLISEYQHLIPGQTQYIGVYMQPEAEWHTYWQNPGDSGEASSFEWRLPSEIMIGDVLWPIPKAIPVAHLTNYGYAVDNLLSVPITVPVDYTQTNTEISVDVSWLVCKEDCIPGDATLSIQLPLGASPTLSAKAALFADNRERLPQELRINGRHEITDSHVVVDFSLPTQSRWHLFPLRDDLIVHSAEQLVMQQADNVTITVPKSAYFNNDTAPLEFLVSDGNTAYYLTSDLNAASPIDKGAKTQSIPIASLATFALMAFLGGLILNLMPCVLPILALKALSLQQHESVRSHAWVYLAGVVVSFDGFALLITALKSGGDAVGWGFHMQQPLVIIVLAFLFTTIALQLWDVLPSSGRFAGVGQRLTEGGGRLSQFFTGVLAVVVASPCTAPFMATALGVAMVSPTFETFVLFNALALGFALPLTLVALSPRLSSWLPKPGTWMTGFKHFMAFPMLGTVVWLGWILNNQSGSIAQAFLLTGLLLFALFMWIAGRHFRAATFIGIGGALSCFILVFIATPQNTVASSNYTANHGFSESLLQQQRDNNRVVLVNLTADWCITCKVNEHLALSTDAVTEFMQVQNVAYLVGDWTNKNDELLAYLNQYDRAGVPLYVVYGGNKHVEVLPQILTPDIVIQAIKRAQEEMKDVS